MKLCRLLLLAVFAIALAGCATTGVDPDDEERSAEELYEQAHAAARRGEFETAVEHLEQLQARYPFGILARQAQLDIIYMYYEADEPDSAITAADRYIRLYPRDENIAYAYYMRATANMNRGQDFFSRTFRLDRSQRDPEPLRQAYADFSYLVQHFPDSPYAQDARERIVRLYEQLAEHELHVARFYMRRGAYVAAAQRAQDVVDNFPDTPASKRALKVLAQAYERLNLPDLQQEVLTRLEQSRTGS